MRHDFLKRQIAPLKTIPKVGNCDCLECQKSSAFNQQYARRMHPFDNGTDFTVKQIDTLRSHLETENNFDLNDAKLLGIQAWSYLNGRPDLAKSAEAVSVIKKADERAKATNTPFTLTSDDKKKLEAANTINKAVADKGQAIKDAANSVGSTITGFISGFKWVLIGLIILVVAGAIYKLKS